MNDCAGLLVFRDYLNNFGNIPLCNEVKKIFRPGDQKIYELEVAAHQTARFPNGEVHPVYSTFALAQDAEWTCRLFVLDMLEEGEEGIGISLQIDHLSPALVGSKVRIIATVERIGGSRMYCRFEAFHNQRLLARGSQGQQIVSKSRLFELFSTLQKELS